MIESTKSNAVHAEKIYEKANDQHIDAYVLYAEEADGYLYKEPADVEDREAIPGTEVIKYFTHGCVIVNEDDDVTYKPVAYSVSSNVVTVDCLGKTETTVDTTTTISPAVVSFVSSEAVLS